MATMEASHIIGKIGVKGMIDQYGYEKAVDLSKNMLLKLFNENEKIRKKQIRQFLREEADAMSEAGGAAAKAALQMFPNKKDFCGAMDENPVYPIDYPGGPQQTLLGISMRLMNEANLDLCIKFRIDVVKSIWEISAKVDAD